MSTKLTGAQWRELHAVAKECQRTWGMGFPVISIHLLEKILRDEPAVPIPRYPNEYLAK